jgi:PTH1 family peptidyl-tRNA hydrolase
MTNTYTRAHVGGPQPIPASPKSIPAENPNIHRQQASDDKNADTSITIPQSRKEKRQQRKQKSSPSPSPRTETAKPTVIKPSINSDYDSDSDTPTTKPKKSKKKKPSTPPLSSLPQSLDLQMPPGTQTFYPLLVCSLGNPGAIYANTLHSAGHTVLSVIQARGLYAPFSKGLSGLVSRPDTTRFNLSLTGGYTKSAGDGLVEGEDDFVLWQSTTLMNISGPSVRKAWTSFSAAAISRNQTPRLVIVHDELEAALGKVSVKDGGASPRGHNGLKSCQASLGGVKWWRVGVGIGRPESREPSVVSKYVLSKMGRREQAAVESSAYGVLEALREIQEGKK